MRKWLAFFLCLVLLLAPTGFAPAAPGKPPAPTPMGIVNANGEVSALQLPPPSNVTTPGTWFLGATPPNADPSKPPIVFVQGMNGRAQDWWDETEYHGLNDMYEKAYQAGYRTAFVQLYDAGGTPKSQWDNGQLLASMLQSIYNHFGQKVNIVAHSKGGPDTQAALIHYGAHPYVGRVVTLGSPHHGSHLADLAYSWWAGWLADLLGQKTDATYSLQTGQMAQYRQQTDGHANATKNTYYTAAGTNWGPLFSALQMGGLYLSQYGDNDGLVNVWSTYLPYGNHLFTADLDHDKIRTGSAVFGRIESVLRSSAVTANAASAKGLESTEASAEPVNQYMHGGPLAAGAAVSRTIHVDEGAKEALFHVLTKSPDVQVKLVSPSGKTYDRTSREWGSSTDEAFFRGASVQGFKISAPESGSWTLTIQSPKRDAYFLLAGWRGGTSPVTVKLPALGKGSVPVEVKLTNGRIDPNSVKVDVKAVRTVQGETKSDSALHLRLNPASGRNLHAGKLAVSTPGVYNITVEITGKTVDGQPFTRTFVKSASVSK
ncbi:esterase/lipase family protein [Staphylospora marina]|uniref:esterase/lipase family protein n=1 Tax=Staphylospora marina TaxID=2490858 RepID=UPI000F5C13B8|nr:hypothetical protein [Staphylospora marina]